jgi:steroid delta-isomerase-like uncharacterized protein
LSETPGAIIDRLMSAFESNDAEIAAAVYSQDVVITDPMYDHDVEGRDAATETFRAWFRAFRMLSTEIVETITQGSRVALYWKWTAVHQGEFMGVPASGKEFDGWHLMFFDTADGHVTRDLTCWDATQLLALQSQAGGERP